MSKSGEHSYLLNKRLAIRGHRGQQTFETEEPNLPLKMLKIIRQP